MLKSVLIRARPSLGGVAMATLKSPIALGRAARTIATASQRGGNRRFAGKAAVVGLVATSAAAMSLWTPTLAQNSPATGKVRCLEEEEGLAGAVEHLLTKLRDERADHDKFVFFTDRLLRIILEVAIASVRTQPVTITTPTGAKVDSTTHGNKVAGISILRSGDAFMNPFVQLMPGSPTGKLLLVKHEVENPGESEFQILYSKMPKKLQNCKIFLMDPLMASGSTMILALRFLVSEHKVDPKDVTVLSMISCPKGVAAVQNAFPEVNIVTAAIDKGLDPNHYIYPGLGSFGDRYFGTH